jgi:proton-dependent oligopeptide transporter, POT family
MFKNHPKGLVVAFFSNMGERFGFYTMMACLVFYLQAKYNLSATKAGDIYSWFYFAIYAFALIGGLIADGTRNYKGTIFFGILTMLGGYIVMSTPIAAEKSYALGITIAGLSVIAFGNGLFKGNLQAVVGQMYDDPKYNHLRDSAFSVFYMGINMGAFIAPFAANGIRNWYLGTQHFSYGQEIQAYAAKFYSGNLPLINSQDWLSFSQLSQVQMGDAKISNLTVFVQKYLEAFATGYNYAFGVAAFAMIISFVVFIIWRKWLPDKKKIIAEAEKTSEPSMHTVAAAGGKKLLKGAVSLGLFAITVVIFYFIHQLSLGLAVGLFVAFASWIFQNSNKIERPRVNALMLVYIVVIFFWMSFHQNGLTLAFFARDFTADWVGPVTNMLFYFPTMLCILAFIFGLAFLIRKKSTSNHRIIGAVISLVGIVGGVMFYNGFDPLSKIEPELFQSFNPMFIVLLTPVILAFFAYLNRKKKEPSSPRKIGIGMILASFGFIVMIIGSFGLESPLSLAGTPSPDRISPYWLINTYLVLTIAELFLSPMGLSFVAKVAPSRFQGLMQGGWLLATAVGNKLLFVGSTLWEKIEIWQLWLVFVACCLASAAFVFIIMKRLENATK